MATTRNSAQWCALRMLRYLGVTTLAPKPDPTPDDGPDDSETYLAEGDLDEIASIQTAALQDIFDDAPAQISNVSTGGALFAPATITLNVTQGSSTVSVVSGWLPWMAGCSCLVGGDGFINEFVTSTALRRPFMGATATGVQATVFGNAILLDPSVKNVLGPVEVPGQCPLLACSDRAEFDRVSGCHFLSCNVQSGWPAFYLVETRYDPALDYLPVYLRIAPTPQSALPITFKAKLNPPVVSVDDLGTSDNDPSRMLPIPGQWVESIFLPYCIQRLTGTPLFSKADAKPEIARQFAEAKKKLAKFKPQLARTGGLMAFRP